jgi:DNA mismatch endonuclease (patch repair protein)
MAKVRARGNQSTEVRVAETLEHRGITGWVRHPQLLGNPDFYFPDVELAVFVDGCFWHGCPKHLRLPTNNADYWQRKIDRNRRRDNRIRRQMRMSGIHVARIWEHDLADERWVQRIGRLLERYRETAQ